MTKRLILLFSFLCSTPAWGAIASVSASQTICSQTSASAGTACTLAAPTTAGNTIIAGLTWSNASASIKTVVGNVGSSYFFPYAQVCGAGSCSAILICRNCAALTAVTPNFTQSTLYNLSTEEYSGVAAIGITGTATGTSTAPGITITSGDPNDWLVAVTSSPGNAGIPAAGTGNLRSAVNTGSSGSDVAGAACDNTVAAAGSLSCSVAITSSAWSAVGVELRTSYPTTYIWPDCDSTHPCVIHEKDTVAHGTYPDILTGPFIVTVPPTLPGNLMKLTISHPSAKTVMSISDDHSNAWVTGATTTDSSNAVTTEVRYVCGAATGTSVITVGFDQAIVTGDVVQFSYDEVSGIAASACGDGSSGSSGSQGVLSSGPITTTSNGDLIFAFGICASGNTEYGNQAGLAMPDDVSAKIAENDFDQFMSMAHVQASAGAISPTMYANAQDVNNNYRMYWNIVAQAFKASSGAGTEPSSIQVVTDIHFSNWNVLGWNPLPSNGNAIVFSSSNPSGGYDMGNLTDNYGTTYTRTPYTDAGVDPQQDSACLGANVSARDRIFSFTPDVTETHVEIYTIAGAMNASGTGCVGTTVNGDTGNQGSTLNANIVGDPVITPTINSGYNSAIFATGYTGTGPPTGMCISGGIAPPACTGESAGVIFNSIYATGMTDGSGWYTGDPYAFFYTNSTSPRSIDYTMANGMSATGFDGAAIEILGAASGQVSQLVTPAVTVAPSTSSITTLQTLSVTVTVSGGSGNPTPTGAVTLTGGGYSSVTTTLSGGSATINIPANTLSAGSYTFTASYTPDTTSSPIYSTASGTASSATTVSLTTPTVTVTPSSSSITTLQTLSVTVTVSGGSGNPTPTGAVTLTGGGYSSVATTLSGGSATINIPANTLSAGSYTFTASYTPDTTSSPIYSTASGTASSAATVSLTTPTVTVTPSSSSITTLQTTLQTLSVTVTVSGGSGAPTATGLVTLTSGSYTSIAGALSGGSATINVPAGSLEAGTDTLTATYTPDSNSSSIYAAAIGTTSVTVISAAAITSPTPGSTLTSASTTFTWNAGPAGTTGYGLNVGTSPGAADLVNIGPLSGPSVTVKLPTNGTTIYVRLWTILNGTTYLSNDYTYTEFTQSAITSPAPGSTLTSASTTFTWSPGAAGTTGYGLNVGTSPGGADLVNVYPLSGTSTTVNLPTNGTTIYVRLWMVLNGTTFLYNDYTYTEFTQAVITSPAPGSTLTSAATTFTWSAGPAGTTGYGLNVGTSPGGADLVNIGPLSGPGVTVNLPTDGTPIFVRLWTILNGTTYFYNDYAYTEFTQ